MRIESKLILDQEEIKKIATYYLNNKLFLFDASVKGVHAVNVRKKGSQDKFIITFTERSKDNASK